MLADPICDLQFFLHTHASTRSLSGSVFMKASLSQSPMSTRTTVSKGAKANQPMKASVMAKVAAQKARMCGLVALRRPQCGTGIGPIILKGRNSVHFCCASTGTSNSTPAAAMFQTGTDTKGVLTASFTTERLGQNVT